MSSLGSSAEKACQTFICLMSNLIILAMELFLGLHPFLEDVNQFMTLISLLMLMGTHLFHNANNITSLCITLLPNLLVLSLTCIITIMDFRTNLLPIGIKSPNILLVTSMLLVMTP